MPAPTLITPGMALLNAAQAAARTPGDQIGRLYLNPVQRGIPSVDIADALVSARAPLTIDGASTLAIGIEDPDWLIEESGLLDVNDDGRLSAIDVSLDHLHFRIAQGSRNDPDVLGLTFEDKAVALLRTHNTNLTASRGSMTRAQFIERMVREVKAQYIPFYAPEKGRKQPVARPDYPAAAPSHGETGFDKGAKFKIKSVTADAEQMRNVATVMGVCDQENVTPRVRLAVLVAGIGESDFRKGAKDYKTGTHVGVFQSNQIPASDLEGQARAFLRGGRSFLAGGAIGLAKDHPGMPIGEIAARVEISDGSSAYYQSFHDEAAKIAALWNSGDQNQGAHESLYVKAYQFTRGLPGKREDSFEAGQRLAEEVAWRFYVVAGVSAFVSDDLLITNPAGLVIDDPDNGILLERPTYDWDHGKIVGDVTLRVLANRWEVLPGGVVLFDGKRWGPLRGRWLVETVDPNLLDPTDCIITLTKPVTPHKEPAPEVIGRTTGSDGSGDDSTSGTGAAAAVSWAQSKLGHYKEEWTNNRGTELDKLEGQFHMRGQPWCAIFATTAVAQGAGDAVKSASVAQIRDWAQAGTHGYQRGFRGTPQPGDLMCFGIDHVALVEKVHGDTVTTLEGNTSANKVARLTRATSSGTFVRPDYRS